VKYHYKARCNNARHLTIPTKPPQIRAPLRALQKSTLHNYDNELTENQWSSTKADVMPPNYSKKHMSSVAGENAFHKTRDRYTPEDQA
jgi:hypothetical protein